MARPAASLPMRLAQWSLNVTLRFWPEESRHWGRALAAELHSISGWDEAILWTLGGLMLFLRSLVSHLWGWMKLPSGSGLSSALNPLGQDSSRFPRLPRFVVALLLLSSVVLLLLPRSQKAVSTVRSSWSGQVETSGDLRELDALARRAEQHKDARTLVFVALCNPDPYEAIRLADQAISIDPSLIWINSTYRLRPPALTRQHELLQKLQAADASNSVVYLMLAEEESSRFRAQRASRKLDFVKFQKELAADPAWLDLMQLALRAPRYESYTRRRSELIHSVWSRERSLTPGVYALALWSVGIPGTNSLNFFSELLTRQAKAARASGHTNQAERTLQELIDFGGRMAQGSATDFEQTIGMGTSVKGLKELQATYAESGQSGKEKIARLQLLQIEERIDDLGRSRRATFEASVAPFRRAAMLVQVSATLMIVFALVACVSLVLLELRALWIRTRSTGIRHPVSEALLSFAVDWAPVALLAACVVFLLSYWPFANSFEQLRLQNPAPTDRLVFTSGLSALLEAPNPVSYCTNHPENVWMAITVVLSAAAIFVLLRGLLRRPTKSPS